jgi:L-lysine 6-transaminase
MSYRKIEPADVRATVAKHMLVDGFRLVVDLDKSHGSWLLDQTTGREYLDFYTFFASSPLGFNHPRLRTPEFLDRLARAGVHKPANSDMLTVQMAEFVETCAAVAMPAELPHLFLIEGGALAVENAMKAAFDWKARKNLQRGIAGGGSRILHFREAFHGRSGYTLSVTNTDPVKTEYYPKFDWPRVSNPKLAFPLTAENRRLVEEAERQTLNEIDVAFATHPNDIAAILIEPIQCEGGDNHFRGEFLQALRRIADEREALLIFDEVQTGLGVTGRMWAYEHFGVVPDIIAFSKKMQVGGIFCSRRIEEVEDHVFTLSSRGGGLVDVVRATEILRVIDEENVVENAGRMGRKLLDGITALASDVPGKISNVRGLGLLVAFDLKTKEARTSLREACYAENLIVLTCGERSIRLRPALNVSGATVDEALERLGRALRTVR